MTVAMSEEGTAPLPTLPGRRRPWGSRRDPGAGAGGNGRRRGGLLPYVLLVPTLVAIGAGLGYPLVRLVVLSTQEYGRRQQFGAPAEFVGTDNFAEIFGSPYFWDVLWRSLLFCAVNVALTLVLGTLLALLLERLGTVMRTALSVALLLAWATPALTATIVWQWIFDARYGVVNWLLTGLGGDFEGHSWLSSQLSFFFVATLVVVWMGVPFVAFTLYAGMTQISPEVVEAAAIDGASAWDRFRDVTWPALKPIFVVLAALSARCGTCGSSPRSSCCSRRAASCATPTRWASTPSARAAAATTASVPRWPSSWSASPCCSPSFHLRTMFRQDEL